MTLSGRTPVFIYSPDPVSAAGAKSLLMWEPSVELVCPADVDRARVALVLVDAVDESVVKAAQAIRREGRPQVIAVAAHFEEDAVIAAVAAGVSGFVRRSQATKAVLVEAIRDVDVNGCSLPEGLLRRAAECRDGGDDDAEAVIDLSEPDREGGGVVTDTALSVRDLQILRLVSEGFDTADVAEQLAYSESTIKGVLTKIMTRLEARNRCHAVAVAVRQGLI